MNNKTILPIAFIILLLTTIGTVSAQSSIGVSQGDRFTYAVSSNSNIPLIHGVINDPKNVATLTITIQSTTAPNMVTMNMTQQFKNGTQTSWVQNKDLTSAFDFPMIAKDLNVGDSLWSGEPLSPKVNDTITSAVSGASRQINHAYIGMSESGYDLIDYYFDKSTGMPNEVRFVESELDQRSTILTLTSTSSWTIPEFSSGFTVIVLFALVSVIIISVYKRQSNQICSK